MNILSYTNVLVKYKASFLYYMYKGIFFFDFLIIAPYLIQLKKGSFPIQEGPLDLPIYKITICKINKISYNKHKSL